MKTSILTKLVSFLLVCLSIMSCTDPYQMKTDTFEDAIVIEATITNVLEKQTLKLSRTYRFEDAGPVFEEDATVTVTDSDGNVYNFVEENETYVSTTAFQAVTDKQYQLSVTTSDGRKYVSNQEILPAVNNIESVAASVQTQDNVRGVEIRVKSFDPTNSSKYYRYEYEETYKIISPKWRPYKAVITGPQEIEIVPRTEEAQTCYSTDKSTDIILVNTNETQEDRVDFAVRFISAKNYIISHRYSILVRQYVQNLHAFTFYKNLKKISGSGNILSPNQPGFLSGNIKCVNSPNEKVIGFFDVASVSSKRIFFNYADLFPGEQLPPFKVNCNEMEQNLCFSPVPTCHGGSIMSYLGSNTMAVYEYMSAPVYVLIPTPCADCTSFSSNVIPPFWE